MKTLIVEDDFTCRVLLQEILKDYGPTHIAVNGTEAITAVQQAIETKEPYDFMCLDIMIPEKNGHEVLHEIKDFEEKAGILPSKGIKVAVTTGLKDKTNIMSAFREQCDAYLIKPLDQAKLLGELRKLGLIK
jgi:two-component system, chemotaxis family, chemotaxis protein CheY